MRPSILAILATLWTSPSQADPPNFMEADADKVLDACLTIAPDALHEPHTTCHRMMRDRYAALEPDVAGSSFGLLNATHHAVGAWRRRIDARYAEILATFAAPDPRGTGFAERNTEALKAMRAAWPAWVQARCAVAEARNGGGYDHHDYALCEEYMLARHWRDLADLDAVLGCWDCASPRSQSIPIP